jgi:hypothetical protein
VYYYDGKLYIAAEYLDISLDELDFQSFQLGESEIAAIIVEVRRDPYRNDLEARPSQALCLSTHFQVRQYAPPYKCLAQEALRILPLKITHAGQLFPVMDAASINETHS